MVPVVKKGRVIKIIRLVLLLLEEPIDVPEIIVEKPLSELVVFIVQVDLARIFAKAH